MDSYYSIFGMIVFVLFLFFAVFLKHKKKFLAPVIVEKMLGSET